MASQSAIAQSGSVVTADQINYQQKMFSHPDYKFELQQPNTYGQDIVLGVSQTPVTINIPPNVFNLSQSQLLFSVVIPASVATNTYTWYANQALSAISHIQFYAGSNQYIADIDNLQNYLDIVIKKETESDEFLSLDPLTGVSQSNSVVNVVPALRNSTIAVINTPNGAANASSVNYLEPAYFSVSAAATAVTINVQFPLKLIKNSIFSIDKNLYFGQLTYLKLYFGPLSKVCYSSDSNANPSAGAKISFSGLAAATVKIQNLQLMLAEECNQDLVTMIKNKVAMEGQSYMIPYVQAFKNANSGTTQNINIQFNEGNGRTLMKVYHALYNNTEDLDIAYDHANTATVSGVVNSAANQKVFTYYTTLNGKRSQDITIDCTPTGLFLDYMQHKKQLRGSILSNLNVYQYNWFHCDDFSDFGSRYDQDNKGELISGIPMSVAPLTWGFTGLTMRSIALQHYTWAVFVKKLTMTAGTVEVN